VNSYSLVHDLNVMIEMFDHYYTKI